MSDNKKYYWLKLKENFFEDDTIAWIEEQSNGVEYVNFYLKLCLKSLQNEGHLIRYVGEMLIPYDIQALAKLTNTNVDTARTAMTIFTNIGLIETCNSGEIYLTQINEMIGSETDKAELMRKKRARDAIGGNNVTPALPKCYTEIELEIEKDIEINKDIEIDKPTLTKPIRHKHGEYQNVLLTDDDFEKLKDEAPNDWKDYIERLSSYMASTGKSYKNHLATMRNWIRKDKKGESNGQNKQSDKPTNSRFANLPATRKWDAMQD